MPKFERTKKVAKPSEPMQTDILGGTGMVKAFPMIGSNELWQSCRFSKLKERFRRDGYLWMRGFLNRAEVHQARLTILNCIDCIRKENGNSERVSLLQHQEVAHHPLVESVLENDSLFALASLISDDMDIPRVTLKYKWLRAVQHGEFTGLHTDEVYFGHNAPSLLTIWIPFGDIPSEQGTLLVSTRYHAASEFAPIRHSYGHSHVGTDGTGSGWYTSNAADLEKFGDCRWVCSDMQMGDIVVLHHSTMHMSTTNKTDELRLSCDTRWHQETEKLGPELVIADKRMNNGRRSRRKQGAQKRNK